MLKAEVAMAAARGDKTLAELAAHYDGHANQIQNWKNQLLEKAAQLFGGRQPGDRAGEATVQRLHAKIRELTMERDFYPWRSIATSERVQSDDYSHP